MSYVESSFASVQLKFVSWVSDIVQRGIVFTCDAQSLKR